MLLALVIASFAPDILDATFALLRICSPYGLYSHTIPAVAIQAAVVGGLAYLATNSRPITISFVSVVILHIAADYFTGRKLLMPGGEMIGLRWYQRPLYDFLVEGFLLAAGWALFRRTGQGPRWARSGWLLVAALGAQGVLDVTLVDDGGSLKPTACFHGPTGRMSTSLTRVTR